MKQFLHLSVKEKENYTIGIGFSGMKFVLEHVLIGHLLDVQTSKLVSRQDGNSLSAFDILRPQVTAGM